MDPTSSSSSSSKPAAASATSQQPQQQQQQQQQLERELAQLSHLAVKQQNELGDLRQQVAALQAAVCKLDPAAPGCKPQR